MIGGGAACKLAGLDKSEFQYWLGEHGVFQPLECADYQAELSLLVRGFSASLHRGEAECLALAMEHPGSLLILDDLSARAHASANQLPFTGTLGILAAAKARGRLPALAPAALAPVICELRTRARFWISPSLEKFILEEAGELE